MRRYIPKRPLLSGLLSGFFAFFMQVCCVLFIGIVNFYDYGNYYLDAVIILLSLFTSLMCLKTLHDLCYGIIGRNIKDNKIFLTICPQYKKIHDDMPLLNNVKFAYEYPLSAIGFIDTLDDMDTKNNYTYD